MLDSTEEEDHEAAYREQRRRFGLESSPADKVIFGDDLERETKRIMKRHRLDFAKMYFDKDGGYTLREFKRIFKIEMEENPDRYTLRDPKAAQDSLELSKDVDEARKRAIQSGAQLFEIDAERQDEIRQLREQLDAYTPKLQEIMDAKKNSYE